MICGVHYERRCKGSGRLADYHRNVHLRLAAVEELKDQAFLANIAENNAEASVRRTAAHKLARLRGT
jgi:hypothetical protein